MSCIGHIVIGDRLWRVAHISRRNPSVAPSEIEAYDASSEPPRRRVRWLLAERVSELDDACAPLLVDAEPTPIMEQRVAEALGFLPQWACKAVFERKPAASEDDAWLRLMNDIRDEGVL